MGKKKHHAEEHENLERWLVSYADFITLLFATFVVLYALSQSDIAEFTKMQDSIRKAFSAPSILQGNPDVMSGEGKTLMSAGTSQEDQAIIPPILEYVSQKYEQKSFEEIKEDIEKLEKEGKLGGVEAAILDRGLVINIKDLNLFFNSGTADLKAESQNSLKQIGKLIRSKFASHLIRVEGHTDNVPIKSTVYPSNWELSSARASSIVRFLLDNFKFKKERFAALGYADTKPLKKNSTEAGRQANRRVEIVVLRNKYSKSEPDVTSVMASKLKENTQISEGASPTIQMKEYQVVSEAARKLAEESGISSQNVVILGSGDRKKKSEVIEALEKFEAKKANRYQKIQKEIIHTQEAPSHGNSNKSSFFDRFRSVKKDARKEKSHKTSNEQAIDPKEEFFKVDSHEQSVFKSIVGGFSQSSEALKEDNKK